MATSSILLCGSAIGRGSQAPQLLSSKAMGVNVAENSDMSPSECGLFGTVSEQHNKTCFWFDRVDTKGQVRLSVMCDGYLVAVAR